MGCPLGVINGVNYLVLLLEELKKKMKGSKEISFENSSI